MSKRVKVQGGKLYTRVVDRLTAFKEHYPVNKVNVLIHTEIHTLTDSYVVFKATISKGDTILATGHGFNAIAKEKAFEKAETVAVGRALAFFDPQYGGESELASQEEMEKFAELTKDDGSQFPPQQTKRNGDLSENLQNQVDKAKSQMNGTSNGQVKPSDDELDTSIDGICMFPKYQGIKWSEVAKKDDWYVGIIHKKSNLDDTTRTIVNHYYEQLNKQVA